MAKLLTRVAGWVVVVVLVLFGLAAAVVGGPGLAQGTDLSAKTFAYYAISLLAGLTLLLCSVLSFRNAWRRSTALASLAAAVALPLNQFLGLHFQAILCFTPS